MSDQGQLVPLIDGIEKNLGRKPKEAAADKRLRENQRRHCSPRRNSWPADNADYGNCNLQTQSLTVARLRIDTSSATSRRPEAAKPKYSIEYHCATVAMN